MADGYSRRWSTGFPTYLSTNLDGYWLIKWSQSPRRSRHARLSSQVAQLNLTPPPSLTVKGKAPTHRQISESQPRPSSKGSGLVSWNPALQLSVPGAGADLLDHTKPQSSAPSHSTVVNDLGNAQYLADNQPSSDVLFSNDSRASTTDLVAHLGAGLTDTAGCPALREADVRGQCLGTPQDKAEWDNLEYQPPEEDHLGMSIRAALRESAAGGKEEYLPIDALDRIVTRSRVRWELSRLDVKVVPPDKLDSLTDDVWKVASPSAVPSCSMSKFPDKETTRKKIFAILGLMEKYPEIVNFIQEGLHDNDLPFILSNGPYPGSRQLDRKGSDGKLRPIQLFNKWRLSERESFNNYQWQLIAPYFHLSTKPNQKVQHYNFEEHRIVLPYIEDDEGKRGNAGGYGDVWRVKIHPAHHNGCGDSTPSKDNPSYAVKRLRLNNYEAFEAEVSNLKRVSKKDHLHLIKLLVTFKWREQFYLLFPWADGNLLDFWKLYPQPSHLKRDRNMAVWFSGQCLGIVQGLMMIHTADRSSTDGLSNSSGHQIHGRHGDLKPENILWFKAYQDTDLTSLGVLKISDFGLTRFHRTRSKSHFGPVAVSPTYRPPEYDVAKMVSPSFDIWTLGCVLLQFVAWYLLGWEEVDRFSEARTADDRGKIPEDVGKIPEDVFFKFVNLQTGARAKVSVADEFQTLSEHQNCYDFLFDILTFIKKRLLRMDPKNRADCKEIVEKFRELNNLCLADPDYCTKRVKVTPTRSGTDLSEVSESTLRSQEGHCQMHRTPLPKHTDPLENDSQLLGTLPQIKEITTSPSDHNSPETQSLQPQSPAKKVHFEEQQQQLPEPGVSGHEDDMGIVRDELLDDLVQTEKQSEVNRGHVIQSDPGSPSIVESVSAPNPPGPPVCMNHPADDEEMGNTLVDNDGPHELPLNDRKSSILQTRNNHGDDNNDVTNRAKITQGDSNGDDSHVDNVFATLKRLAPRAEQISEPPLKYRKKSFSGQRF
ncbi:uncharacterized protein BP5553_06831 [Venustampulla echinocandica]|uniref:Protein kinase domain-containing protein n=1 Tax=Venustampulla echinocandica TaxID=2656787 RepID=A0A370TL15_9HELO|nr:uncharacterized protein BP5553_06831 [Venustampulla echinocandica]RDL36219.1 hypothetical protein BP5553_06831 [Venustampulla echinocandica]